MNDENNLTIDLDYINSILEGIRVDMPSHETESPLRPSDIESESFLVLEQRGLVRLSDETRQREVERLEKLHRKKLALRKRKPYTRKAGCVHPKKKAATRKRKLTAAWAAEPYWCVVRSWGWYDVDRKQWDQHMQPYWQTYLPAELEVVRPKRDMNKKLLGTKDNPYRLYNLQLIHTPTGAVLFDGESLRLWELSS